MSLHGAERRLLAIVTVALLAGGCAASAALSRGRDFERRQEYDAAVAEYTQAVRQKPNDPEARLALDRAKLRAALDHFNRGRRHDAVGRYDQALVEYEAAAELNPSSGDYDTAVRETRNKLRAKIAVTREGKTELQTLIDRTRLLPAPGLDLPTDVTMPESLFFSGASSRLVFLARWPTSASLSTRRSAMRR
jgi:tetratricopeptide (TPR) repeat protein